MNTSVRDDLDVAFDGHVAVVEIRRPPHNHFDIALIAALADAFERLEADAACRAIVLCAQGTAFCAGADFAKREDSAPTQRSPRGVNPLYAEALRLVLESQPAQLRVIKCRGGLPPARPLAFAWH